MIVWILCLPLAFLLFGTAFLIMHGVSPLGRSIVLNNKTRIGIYGVIATSILTFILPFTNIMSPFSHGWVVIYLFAASLLSVFSTECSYFLSKKQKWNKVLVAASGIMGIIFWELALVVGYVYTLPPGSVS